MNKNTFAILFSLLVSCVMTGCKDDYLDLDPIASYTYYSFPKNEDQVGQAVVGCYAKAYAMHNNQMWVFGELMSDNTSFYFNPNDRGGINTENLDEMVAAADNGNFRNLWADSYDGILRSNYVLENIEAIPFRDPAVKNTRIGEAKFWRAWHYFNLVRLYGDVPLITKVTTSPTEGLAYQREAVDKIYEQLIVSDAMDAAAKLPVTIATNSKGRLSQGAATMLLAKIYMTQGRYTDAVTELTKLEALGYTLNAKYVDNFDPTKKNGPESILEMQSDAAQGVTFGFMSSWIPWGTGTNIWPGGSNSRGGLNQPTTDLINAYESADSVRKSVTIGTFRNIPYLKKFAYWDLAARSNPVNFPVYRYADALLMLAESLNEQGQSATALTYLNRVRTRAKLAALDTLTQQAGIRLAIEKERRLELAGENHRWFDLVRTGRLEAVMTEHGISEKANKKTVTANAYTNIRPLIAIPTTEVIQWKYPQNPGW